MAKSDKSMSHEGYSSTLGSGTEEGGFDLSSSEIGGIILNSSPRSRCNCLLEAINRCQTYRKCGINFHHTLETNLQ